jgi:hypothetical protein
MRVVLPALLLLACDPPRRVVPEIEIASLAANDEGVFGGFTIAADTTNDAWVSRRSGNDAVFDIVFEGASLDRITALDEWSTGSTLRAGTAQSGAGVASLDRLGGLRWALAVDLAETALTPTAIARFTETMVVVGTGTAAGGSFGFVLELDETGTVRRQSRFDLADSLRFDDVLVRADGTFEIAASAGAVGLERPVVVVIGPEGDLRSASELTGVQAAALAMADPGTGVAIAGATATGDVFVGTVSDSGVFERGWIIDDTIGTSIPTEIIALEGELRVSTITLGRGFDVEGDVDLGEIAVGDDGSVSARVLSSLDRDRPLEARARGDRTIVLGAIGTEPARWDLEADDAGCGRLTDELFSAIPTPIESTRAPIATSDLGGAIRELPQSITRVLPPKPFVCRD